MQCYQDKKKVTSQARECSKEGQSLHTISVQSAAENKTIHAANSGIHNSVMVNQRRYTQVWFQWDGFLQVVKKGKNKTDKK